MNATRLGREKVRGVDTRRYKGTIAVRQANSTVTIEVWIDGEGHARRIRDTYNVSKLVVDLAKLEPSAQLVTGPPCPIRQRATCSQLAPRSITTSVFRSTCKCLRTGTPLISTSSAGLDGAKTAGAIVGLTRAIRVDHHMAHAWKTTGQAPNRLFRKSRNLQEK